MHAKQCFTDKADDTQARNLRKFSSKFLHLCVDEQYSSNMMSTHNRRNILENLRKFLAHVSPANKKGNEPNVI